MSLLKLNFFSEALGRAVYVNVLLPQATTGKGRGWKAFETKPPFPVLYLLHGLSDDQDGWLRQTSIERYAEKRNLAVVLPTTDRGFYTDTAYGTNYFTYISEELPSVLKQYLPLSERREDTYAAGLSMGGYGALKLALRLPQRFSFAASLSGAANIAARINNGHITGDFLKEMQSIFGETIKPEDDVFSLLETASPKPKLFVCCGTDDALYESNDAFRTRAGELGYDITWRSDEGDAHEWGYWDRMIQVALNLLPEQTYLR
ncbi:MAG: esterase family protein [Oscillospiraceae bacterium]|nr:esterase family protein [Oscillospiraceae bacterium]